MGEVEIAGRRFHLQWSSAPDIDGLRLEAIEGDAVVVDVSVPTVGSISLNTFGNEAPADLVKLVLEMAIKDRANWR